MIVKKESELIAEFKEYRKANGIEQKGFETKEFEKWFRLQYPNIKVVHYSNTKIKIE